MLACFRADADKSRREMKLLWFLSLIVFALDVAVAERKGCRVEKGEVRMLNSVAREKDICMLLGA